MSFLHRSVGAELDPLLLSSKHVWQFTREWFFLQVVLNCSTVELSSNFHHGSSAQRRSDSNKRALTQWGQVLQQRYKGASSNHSVVTFFSSGASAKGPSWGWRSHAEVGDWSFWNTSAGKTPSHPETHCCSWVHAPKPRNAHKQTPASWQLCGLFWVWMLALCKLRRGGGYVRLGYAFLFCFTLCSVNRCRWVSKTRHARGCACDANCSLG